MRKRTPDPSIQSGRECAEDYLSRVSACLSAIGVAPEAIAQRALPLQMEATELEVVAIGQDGREHQLIPAAASAWRKLQAAAASDGATLTVVSAFRGLDRQADIIRGKISAGLSLDVIFCASAPPGYSEHHTGRALDVTTPGATPLREDFEGTPAFAWLSKNAASFGFALSYPRGNRHGFMYEPWHWCYQIRES